MTVALDQRLSGIKPLVGNTPLLALRCTLWGRTHTVYAKAEHLNLTGSIKDRMAMHILEQAYRTGQLASSDRIVEATNGNTGISFAAIGRALGHDVEIFMPDWLSTERVALIRSFGATVRLVTKNDGGFVGSIERTEHIAARERNVFLPRQFANQDNVGAHETSTGPEIASQLQARHVDPSAFVAGVGTGGTIMGVGRFLKRLWPDIRLHPLEPASSPTLSAGFQTGTHRIQGISDEFVPPILNLDELDDVIAARDGDAILMAQKLAAQLGLGVGISSGANFLGALEVQTRQGRNGPVVTVFPDSNKKYLSTDLLKTEPITSDYLSPHVDLLSVEAVGRVCGLCATSTASQI